MRVLWVVMKSDFVVEKEAFLKDRRMLEEAFLKDRRLREEAVVFPNRLCYRFLGHYVV
jgi:hypothetical protein